MNSRPDVRDRFRLTAFWPDADPLRVGVVSALVVGAIGSLSLIADLTADATAARLYVSAVAIWINAIVIGYILGMARVVQGALQKDLNRLGPLLRDDSDTLLRRLTVPRHPRILLLVTGLGALVGVVVTEDTVTERCRVWSRVSAKRGCPPGCCSCCRCSGR